MYVYMPPAVGRCRASCPIDSAVHRQPTRAITTPADRAPPANSAPTVIEKAAPAAGAIVVTDVKITSGSPTASRRSPSAWRSVSCSAVISAPALPRSRSTLRTFGPEHKERDHRCQDRDGHWIAVTALAALAERSGGGDPDQVGAGQLDVRGDVPLGRVGIAALDRVQDLAVMKLRGTEDVLGHLVHGHPQEGARIGDGALHPVVPRGPGYALVER